MTEHEDQRSREASPDRNETPGPDALRGVFDALAAEDRRTLDAVLRENPALAQSFGGESGLLGRIRRALLRQGSPREDAEFDRVVARTQAQLAARRAAEIAAKPEPPGVLTEVTRELSPERAVELYRKIAPLLVFAVIRRLDRSARLDTVQAICDHLCSAAVQERLRASEHVRDGILDELNVCLRDSGVKEALDREGLLAVMDECGAANDLAAMANCLRLSRIKAG